MVRPPAYDRIISAKRQLRLVSQQTSAAPAGGTNLADAEAKLRDALAELQAASTELETEAEALAAATLAANDDAAEWRRICREAPDPFLVTDGDAMIRWANPAAGEALGIQCEFLVGKPLVVYVADGERQPFIRRLTRLKAGVTTRISSWSIMFGARDRAPFPGEASVSLAREDDGRVAKMVWMIRDVSAHRRAEERLLFLGTHDPVTGLYSSAYFEEEAARLTRSRSFPVSVVVAKIHGLSDSAVGGGHEAVEEVLRRAAGVIREVLRAEDVLARTRPDTFAALVPSTDVVAAANLLVRVMHAMTNLTNGAPPPEASFGIATAARGETLAEAIRIADTRAARHGRRARG